MMLARLHNFRRWIGIDRAVVFTLGARGWNIGAGLITMVVVGVTLTQEAQGYYYTFGSVMALQVLLELGMSQSLLQFASHEFAQLSFEEGGRLSGDAESAARLRSLGKLAWVWYGVLALVVLVVVGGGGHYFFAARHNLSVAWHWPWWTFCVTAALNLWLTPVWFLLEGCNQVAAVNRFRLFSGVAASLASWAALSCGAGLFACVAYSATLVVAGATYLWQCWPGFLREIWQAGSMSARGWLKEMWPFQWRIAVSWACGYFTFSILTPLMFQLHGPVLAGQVGMTWQAVNGLIALATAWTQTKAPVYGILIRQRKFAELDRVFWRATTQATAIALAGALVLIGGVTILKAIHPLGERFLGLPALALFCLSAVFMQITSGMAVYLRAHKQEPFMVVSIVGAIAVTVGVAGLGAPFAGLGAALAYLLASGLIALPLGGYIFARKRADWHRAG